MSELQSFIAAEWQNIAITLISIGFMIGVAILLLKLVEAVLGATFSGAAYLIGLLVYGITWGLFVLSALIWIPLSILVVLLTCLFGAIYTKVSPSGRRLWKLWQLSGSNEPGLISALSDSADKGDLNNSNPFNDNTKHVTGLRNLSTHYDIVVSLSDRLGSHQSAAQHATHLTEYLSSVNALEQGLHNPGFITPYWDSFALTFPHPNHEICELEKIKSPKDGFRYPATTVLFLCRYVIILPYWTLYFPISLIRPAFANSQIWPYRCAVKRFERKVTEMKSLLSGHRKSIEDTIKSFAKFQSEQNSVHEQTKALRDELAEELASVREMVTLHKDEVRRVREYVALVKERSDKMDATDPLKEMKSLLKEIRDTQT